MIQGAPYPETNVARFSVDQIVSSGFGIQIKSMIYVNVYNMHVPQLQCRSRGNYDAIVVVPTTYNGSDRSTSGHFPLSFHNNL